MKTPSKTLLALLLVSCTGPALAHPGAHEHVLAAGFLHPLTGLDHLLALLAAGVWSARQPRGGRLLPVFLLAMLAGAVAGMAGLAMPGLETGMAATVVAAGLLVMASLRLPAGAGMALFAAFATLHGNAHGLELPLASAVGYLAGSALLLAAGRAIGARASATVVRCAGAGVALAGMLLLG
ncbi:HupE-UreJ family metal transporter [Duganella ginsengisoli]|uniref:HupE-UreJ family metal transporter n=2 Tax=Pseudoduganella ginsengisoli TaxID=1462440 RepID=A0A6L6Q3J8_9BURK|nr:HupE-UreJ family metal transporter [Pseudoduganella ginsengisoli]